MKLTKRSPLIALDFQDGIPAHGCFFGGGGGSSPAGTTTTTQNTAPWEGQQPYLNELYGAALDLLPYNPQYFPNQTYADLTAPQQQAIGLEQSVANQNLTDPNSVANAMQKQIADTASGAYLPGGSAFDPYFNDFQQNVLSTVVPGLTATFNQGNSLNNPGVARAVAQGATDTLGSLAAQMFEQERGRQLTAASMAPQAQALDFQNIGAISDAGTQLQNQAQKAIDDAVARWNFGQQLPYQKLNNYAALIGGNPGASTTLTQPYFHNNSGSDLSTALSIAGIAAALI